MFCGGDTGGILFLITDWGVWLHRLLGAKLTDNTGNECCGIARSDFVVFLEIFRSVCVGTIAKAAYDQAGDTVLPADLGDCRTFHLYRIGAQIFVQGCFFYLRSDKHISSYDGSLDDLWMPLTLGALKWGEFQYPPELFLLSARVQNQSERKQDFAVH